MKKSLIVILFSLGVLSCKNTEDGYPDVSDQKADGSIIRFDKVMMAAKNTAEMSEILKQYPRYCIDFLKISPDDSQAADGIFKFNQNPELRKFYSETERAFADVKDLEEQFATAFKHIKHYFPGWKEPKIMATFTGLNNDIFVSDSLVVISLEAFLGPKASFRPQQPNYILRRYDRPYIVPQVIHFFSKKFIKVDPTDQTLLADMIYHGKANEFVIEMMPGVADTLVNGYTSQQMKETWAAQDLVYGHFIDKNLLFETKAQIKEKYLEERPRTLEIGQGCPGRIGDWLGWRIIGKYRTENPEVSLKEWVTNPNARQIFEKSGYRGQTTD